MAFKLTPEAFAKLRTYAARNDLLVPEAAACLITQEMNRHIGPDGTINHQEILRVVDVYAQTPQAARTYQIRCRQIEALGNSLRVCWPMGARGQQMPPQTLPALLANATATLP